MPQTKYPATVRGLKDIFAWLETHEEHWDVFDTTSDAAGEARYHAMKGALFTAIMVLTADKEEE